MNGSIYLENGDQTVDIYSDEMESTGFKVFNDSVHGHISLHPLLVKVVDTPEFQRLRNLKQLGVAYYVFPGAGNSRYEHSLGTCYLAGQMIEKLLLREIPQRTAQEKEKLALCVQLAALCHDLGHGPFSHTWEIVTKQWGDDWKHEKTSTDLFDYLVKENNLREEFIAKGLEDAEMAIIKELIMGKPEGTKALLGAKDNFLYEIVNNKETGIDVDKWDYFLRDGLHLNLRITFDYRRLLEFCMVQYSEDDGLTHIAFRDKEVLNLYDMYRVRSVLHYTAYRHKVVTNIEFMFIDAFVGAGNASYMLNNKYSLKTAHRSEKSMSELTDHVFYDILYSNDPSLKHVQKLLQRVLKRDLYIFLGKSSIVLSDKTSQKRREVITIMKKKLQEQLNLKFSKHDFCVGDFYLDLDTQNDPVSKAHFYKKEKSVHGSIATVPQDYSNIRNALSPLPFQLTTEPTAELLVFCKTKPTEPELTAMKDYVKAFK